MSTQHLHDHYVAGCYRCDLGKDEEHETSVPNRLLAILVGADHCEHAQDYCCHDCMTKAMDHGLALLEASNA
jgi:hypothetical protein